LPPVLLVASNLVVGLVAIAKTWPVARGDNLLAEIEQRTG